MKNLILPICIFTICSTMSLAQPETKPQSPDKATQTKSTKVKQDSDAKPKKKPAADDFTALMAEYYKAWNTLNVSNPAKFYSQEPDLIFYDIAPLQYKGWKEYQSGVAALFQGFATFRLIPNNDLKVTRKARVAWTTRTLHVSGKRKDGTPMELDARHTAIWEKAKGKWLIVHEHISAPLPDAAGN